MLSVIRNLLIVTWFLFFLIAYEFSHNYTVLAVKAYVGKSKRNSDFQ